MPRTVETDTRKQKARADGEGSCYRRKDGRWVAQVATWERGKRVRRATYHRTQAEARRALTAARKALDDYLPLPAAQSLTTGAYLERWLRDTAEPHLRPRTFASYAMIVRKHLSPALGRVALVKLSPADVQRYLNDKRRDGLSARTCQYHHAILRAALHQAERWQLVMRNVARLVSPPRGERKEVQPLSPDQARRLIASLEGDALQPIVACAFGLGLRQGELLALAWSDVDLDASVITVRHTLQYYAGAYHLDPPKTQRSHRAIALPAGLVETLRAHRRHQLEDRLRAGAAWQGDAWDLVFCTPLGAPLPPGHLTRRYQHALAVAGLPRQRFHDTRHGAATYMLSQGVPLRVVMEVLGHSQIHVTANTYSHVVIEAQRDAVERVGALLSSGG